LILPANLLSGRNDFSFSIARSPPGKLWVSPLHRFALAILHRQRAADIGRFRDSLGTLHLTGAVAIEVKRRCISFTSTPTQSSHRKFRASTHRSSRGEIEFHRRLNEPACFPIELIAPCKWVRRSGAAWSSRSTSSPTAARKAHERLGHRSARCGSGIWCLVAAY